MKDLLKVSMFLTALVMVPGVRNVSAFMPVMSSTVNSQRSASTRRKMFTGIVEEMGTVVSLEERDDMNLWDGTKGKGTEMVIKGSAVLEGAYLG